jgi:hypothetical protein
MTRQEIAKAFEETAEMWKEKSVTMSDSFYKEFIEKAEECEHLVRLLGY